MRQCLECEFCVKDQKGRLQFRCNPFTNVKEPECINKWMLLKLDLMVRSHQATLNFYRKFAPLQDKMMRHMKRELDEMDEADHWKYTDDDQDDKDDQGNGDDNLFAGGSTP